MTKSPMWIGRSPWARAALGVALFVCLGGPTPGSVGSCSKDSEISDPEQFCLDEHALFCERDFRAERISEDEYNACLDSVQDDCMGFTWNPVSCDPPPTIIETKACISALRSEERLELKNDMIVECQFKSLCDGDN